MITVQLGKSTVLVLSDQRKQSFMSPSTAYGHIEMMKG